MRVEGYDGDWSSIVISWDLTVTCNYGLNYVQTITVTPAPAPSFVSTPNDTTILCADAASYVAAVTVLAYTNKIGRAWGREGAEISVVGVALKKNGGKRPVTGDTKGK